MHVRVYVLVHTHCYMSLRALMYMYAVVHACLCVLVHTHAMPLHIGTYVCMHVCACIQYSMSACIHAAFLRGLHAVYMHRHLHWVPRSHSVLLEIVISGEYSRGLDEPM